LQAENSVTFRTERAKSIRHANVATCACPRMESVDFMGRIVGVDYGQRRLGLAISDVGRRIASPAATLAASGNLQRDASRVLSWAVEQHAVLVVVGLPLNMDGTDSDQTRRTRAFADVLRASGSLPVELWDERLSSFQADVYLAEAGVRPSRRRRLRDALAAQVILQSYLDAHRPAANSRDSS